MKPDPQNNSEEMPIDFSAIAHNNVQLNSCHLISETSPNWYFCCLRACQTLEYCCSSKKHGVSQNFSTDQDVGAPLSVFPYQQNFAMRSLAQSGSGAIRRSFYARFQRSSGSFWCRCLVKTPREVLEGSRPDYLVKIPGEVSEGSGADTW